MASLSCVDTCAGRPSTACALTLSPVEVVGSARGAVADLLLQPSSSTCWAFTPQTLRVCPEAMRRQDTPASASSLLKAS